MNFEIYVTQTTKEPKPFKFNSSVYDAFTLRVSDLIASKFCHQVLADSLNSVLKALLETSGVSSGENKRRDQIVDESRELALNATQLFLYRLQSINNDIKPLCSVNVEIRWDGEVKVTSRFFDLPLPKSISLDLQFTTMDKFRTLDCGYYLVMIPSSSIEKGNYVGYSIASVHPNIVVIGSCFLSDYNPSLIVGYAKLDLESEMESALTSTKLTLWERKK